MPKTKVTSKSPTKKQQVVRLTIDNKLNAVIQKKLLQYPLLNTTEILKMILSDGITKYEKQGFAKAVEIANKVGVRDEYKNLTEDEQFELLAKYDLM